MEDQFRFLSQNKNEDISFSNISYTPYDLLKNEILIDGYLFKLLNRKRNIYRCTNCKSNYNLITEKRSGHSARCRLKKSKLNLNFHSVKEIYDKSLIMEDDQIKYHRIILSDSFYSTLKEIALTKNSYPNLISELRDTNMYFNFVNDRDIYFVKGIPKGSENFNFSLLYEEILIATRYIHPNIMKTHTFFEDKHYVYIVSENFGFDLNKFRKRRELDDIELKNIFKQMVLGLGFLHKLNIIHRDIKPHNILISNGKIKIGDFGRAILTKNHTVNAGTKFFRAPEEIIDNKSDIWSLGCIVLFLLNPTYIENNLFHKYKSVITKKIENKLLTILLDKILDDRSENRPSCEEILKDRYFS